LGQHRGIAFYTIGQRRGLGIAAAHPLYVIAIDPVHNALIVGGKAAVLGRELWAEDVHFVAGSPPEQPIPVTAKIRYRAEEATATLVPLPEHKARVIFEEPQPAITPGQSVVFFQGEIVLGGGMIASAKPEEG
jgi:tRNA-specific 2-thiouridylase